MPENHILKTLEEKPFHILTGDDLAGIESHTTVCAQCKAAYDAARISASLLQARASVELEVPPFFNTRVMAAIRERRLSTEEAPFVRMWRAAGALVSTFAVLLVVLTGMTIFVESPDSQNELASQNLYSPEYVVMQRSDPVESELADDQVVSTIYDLEDTDGQ
jgi:hypothetical protein